MKALTYLLPLFAAVAFAADESAPKAAEKAGPSLKPGNMVSIDALKSAQWIQDKTPEAWEPGKLYIIECWATWCGPCHAVIPHMNELYKNREKDGLRVVGMNVWEARSKSDDPDEVAKANEVALKKATDFVKNQGEKMSYPIAFAGRGSDFEKNWIKAVGMHGIPHAFVVKDGKLLLTTHPARITDEFITDVLAGGETGAKAVESIRKEAEQRQQIGVAMRDFRKAMNQGDAEKMAEVIAKLEKLDSKLPYLPQMRLDLAIARKDWDAVLKDIETFAEAPGATRALGMLAFRGGNDPDSMPAKVRKSVADHFSKALEKTPNNPTSFVVLSRLYWTLDDKEAALKAARDGVAHPGGLPVEPFQEFVKSVEDGKPMAANAVFAKIQNALRKQAQEKANKVNQQLKKNVEEKAKSEPKAEKTPAKE